MNSKHHSKWLGAVAALAVAAGLAPATASATEAVKSSKVAPGLTKAARQAGQKAVGAGERATTDQALTAYWTPERMRDAQPADEAPALERAEAEQKLDAGEELAEAREDATLGERPAPTGPAGKVEPRQPRPSSPALDAKPAAKAAAFLPGYPYYSFPARTAGKVFFTKSNGLNYVCSGTIVNTAGRNSVWTAGHCAHDGAGGQYHRNWVFVPSYSNGSAPYGYWSARLLVSTAGWVNSGDFASDIAVAIMNPSYGYRIVDYLGGQGLTWNQSKRIAVTAFGYPAAAPFSGGLLWGCAGTTFPEWEYLWWSAETLGLACDMTGGSSGGGWLAFFNGNTGYLNGNNSYKYNNNPNVMYSPYYDDTAATLYSITGSL